MTLCMYAMSKVQRDEQRCGHGKEKESVAKSILRGTRCIHTIMKLSNNKFK